MFSGAGCLADIDAIDAPTSAMAVATIAPMLAAFKRGRQTVDRPRRGSSLLLELLSGPDRAPLLPVPERWHCQ